MKTNRITEMVFALVVVSACSHQQDLNVIFQEPELIAEMPHQQKNATSGQHEVNSYEYIVAEILTTSPRFRQLTKGLYRKTLSESENLDLHFGINMEGSPNQRKDMTWNISRSYDFSVYSISAHGKLNIGYFTFNPKNKLLYEYDKAKSQLNAIAFDRDLLLKFETLLRTEYIP